MQQDLLLRTKLYIPRERPDLVARPRLTRRLQEGTWRKLTLISAPAGFGKTTLLSEWIHRNALAAAWVSLDENDNDPKRFLSYLIAALQTLHEGLALDVLSWLQTPQLPTQPSAPSEQEEWMKPALTNLVNEITTIPGNFVLVLDDYHVIESKQSHAAMSFLVEHMPPSMHVVIASRSHPPLPLPRLRARRQLNELGEAEFRFTQEEATTFLNQVMGLGLSAEDVSALGTRTEGWIAGLQLAATALQETLSAQGRAGVKGFIKDFAGSHRYVLDYLTDEVLLRQPTHIQTFLLQTAILEQLSGELCDAVTGRHDGQATLDMLESANLFLFPLDDEQRWYRYHSLFSDLLHHRLSHEFPGDVTELHRRASRWYERNGLLYEALGHALSANDFERAATLVAEAGPTMAMRGEAATLLKWLDQFPEEVIRSRPRLTLCYAWILFVTTNIDAIEPRLRDALRAAGAGENGEAVGRDAAMPDVELFRLEANVLRAFVAIYGGDARRAIDLCNQTRERIPEGWLQARAGISGVLGDAYRDTDQFDIARNCYQDALEASLAMGDTIVAMVMNNDLARLSVALGNLHDAARRFRQVLEWGGGQRMPLYPVGQAYVGLGDLLREWNDLETAETYLGDGIRHCERGGYTRYLMLGTISLARLRLARGDSAGAFERMNQADDLARAVHVPRFMDLAAAYRARLHLAVSFRDLAAAAKWFQSTGLSPEDRQPDYYHEVEYLTLARVRIAEAREGPNRDRLASTRGLLERLLQAAERAGRGASVVEILVLTALAWNTQGDIAKALGVLERALHKAEPEGYVRLFADEGAPMADLLREAARRSICPEYTRRLLAALGTAAEIAQPETPGLAEPLTERELEVLRLLAAGLSSREIAAELVVTVSTAKAHARHIFGKLGVHNRTQAAALARELHLL